MSTTKAQGESVINALADAMEQIAAQVQQIARHLEAAAVEDDADSLGSSVLMFARALHAENAALYRAHDSYVRVLRGMPPKINMHDNETPGTPLQRLADNDEGPQTGAHQIGKLAKALIRCAVDHELSPDSTALDMSEDAIMFARCISREAEAIIATAEKGAA